MVEAMELLGYTAHSWQRDLLDVALEVGPDGAMRFSTVGVCVGRQTGKTTLVLSRIVQEMFAAGRAAYSAQDRILAREKWTEYSEVLVDTLPPRMIDTWSRSNGQEHLTLRTGGRFGISTPGRKSGRGRTNDLVVVDEALTHETMATVAALQPTMATKPNGQIWLLGNAGDHRAVMFRHYRDLGRAAATPRLCWFEYGPDDPECDIGDEAAWAQAIPTLDVAGGISRQAVADAAATMDPADFRREYLNVWDDDLPDDEPDDRLTVEQLEQVTSGQAAPRGYVVFGVDARPDRSSTAICACSADPLVVELVAEEAGVDWAARRCAELVGRSGGAVAYDAAGQAATVAVALERLGVPVVKVTPAGLSQASGMLWDHVTAGTVTFRRHPRFAEAVAAARKGQRGDRWRWVRADVDADISPLIAATVAMYGALTAAATVPDVPRPQVF